MTAMNGRFVIMINITQYMIQLTERWKNSGVFLNLLLFMVFHT